MDRSDQSAVKQNTASTSNQTDQLMTLTGDEAAVVFGLNEFKMGGGNEQYGNSPTSASNSMLPPPSSSRNINNSGATSYQTLDPMKPTMYIKEELDSSVNATTTQLSPLSPTSSGLGSSLHSQSPQNNMIHYFATLNQQQQVQQQQQQSPLTANNVMYIGVGNGGHDHHHGIISASSLNIKNEAFSPQSMDIGI